MFYSSPDFPPVLYSWTEPYGIANHGLIVVRRTEGCFECCLNPKNLHYIRQAVVADPDSYLKNEAGCQTTFVPYSSLDVEQAASLATRLSLRWLLGELTENSGLTYVGDIGKSKTLGIKTSDYYTKDMAYSYVSFKIERRDSCKVCSV